MAIITPKPTFLTDLTLKLGTTDNFEKAISSVLVTPTFQQIEFKGGTPDATFRKVVVTGCTVAITYVQDWESTNSLSRYLQANAGTDVLAEFVPVKGVAGTIKSTVTIAPGPAGGNVDTAATATVTLNGSAPVYTFV